MKIILCIINLLITCLVLSAQTKQADVFPGGGGASENSQYKNFGTFGQPSAGSSGNSSYRNHEGFLQAQAPTIPLVITSAVTDVHSTFAKSGGNIADNGGDAITSSGIIYSLNANAEIGDVGVTVVYTSPLVDDGAFTSDMTGLVNGNTYYVRAFAENSVGIGYGDDISFVSVPTLGEWGMIAFVSLIAAFGGWIIWRRLG